MRAIQLENQPFLRIVCAGPTHRVRIGQAVSSRRRRLWTSHGQVPVGSFDLSYGPFRFERSLRSKHYAEQFK